MNPRLNVSQIISRSFIHYRTNYSSFFYPLPSLKIGGELSGANCPGDELSDIFANCYNMISLTSVIVAIFALAVQIFSKSLRKPFGLSVFLKIISRSSQSCLNSLRMPSLQLHFTQIVQSFRPSPFRSNSESFHPNPESSRPNFKVVSLEL